MPLTLFAEADGSMIPVVQFAPPAATENPDKRKRRALSWKEARLSLVRRPTEVEPMFAVTLGDATTTGIALKRLAMAAGLNLKTAVTRFRSHEMREIGAFETARFGRWSA